MNNGMLEDFRLKVFLAVVKEKSFTKAAASLGISQPAVSQNIAELEKGLNVRLFERLRGETVLTGEGEVFKEYACRLLELASQTEEMFAHLQQTTVRISASEELFNYFVDPSLTTFCKVHPEIKFERSLFEDADLKLSLIPSSGSPYERHPDSIARLRVNLYPTPDIGDLSSTEERASYLEILFQPTPTFACTRLCRLIRTFLIQKSSI